MPFFPSTGMVNTFFYNEKCLTFSQRRHVLIYDFESALTGTRQENDKCIETLFLSKMSFSMKNAFLSQHRNVLICDFESAHRGTRQEK